MSDPVTEAVGRLTRFAVDGVSGNTVYENGIFGLTGPNTFYSDLRTVLLTLSTAQRERDGAREWIDGLAGGANSPVWEDAYADEPPSWATDPFNYDSADKCGYCGAWCTVVRPGKSQCDNCSDGRDIGALARAFLARARKALEQAP